MQLVLTRYCFESIITDQGRNNHFSRAPKAPGVLVGAEVSVGRLRRAVELETSTHCPLLLIRTTNMKREAFVMRIAWAFASIVVLLALMTFLLVVAGYAGSRFALP